MCFSALTPQRSGEPEGNLLCVGEGGADVGRGNLHEGLGLPGSGNFHFVSHSDEVSADPQFRPPIASALPRTRIRRMVLRLTT
jgi:hypothetical protein